MKYLSLTVDSSQQVPVLQWIVIPWLQSHVRLALQIFALPKYCDSQDTTDVLRFMKSQVRRTWRGLFRQSLNNSLGDILNQVKIACTAEQGQSSSSMNFPLTVSHSKWEIWQSWSWRSQKVSVAIVELVDLGKVSSLQILNSSAELRERVLLAWR